jgi:hypothetical protein
MQHAENIATPKPMSNSIPGASLRSEIDRRRAQGLMFTLKEAVAIIVPLCTEVAQHHARGARLFVHPSAIVVTAGTYPRLVPELATRLPTLASDRSCLAPESRHGEAGDARASVFTMGAVLYELLTGEQVGPAMRRPTQVLPGLNPGVDVLLGKALVTDRAHRPDDLGALAQALHHLAPMATIPPPEADEGHLDHGSDFDVDVSLSMLPPAPAPKPAQQAAPARTADVIPSSQVGTGHDPYAIQVVEARRAFHAQDPTARLADLKGRLESDPRPRYVVIKDGMDHGPFSAVELLQQIGTHAFLGSHVLRDTFSGEDRPITEWEEFAPFAEQAKLNRDIVAEKRAFEQGVVAEAKGTQAKTFVGVGAIVLILAALGGWYLKSRGERNDAIALEGEQGVNVEAAGGLKGAARKAGARAAGGGGMPSLPGGLSCETARARYIEEISVGGPRGQADLTQGQFASVLNNGSYIVGCGAPQSMHVNVCAAVQNGHAVGVTVTTDPPNAGIASCVSSAIRRMSFPSNPKLDVATTRF